MRPSFRLSSDSLDEFSSVLGRLSTVSVFSLIVKDDDAKTDSNIYSKMASIPISL